MTDGSVMLPLAHDSGLGFDCGLVSGGPGRARTLAVRGGWAAVGVVALRPFEELCRANTSDVFSLWHRFSDAGAGLSEQSALGPIP